VRLLRLPASQLGNRHPLRDPLPPSASPLRLRLPFLASRDLAVDPAVIAIQSFVIRGEITASTLADSSPPTPSNRPPPPVEEVATTMRVQTSPWHAAGSRSTPTSPTSSLRSNPGPFAGSILALELQESGWEELQWEACKVEGDLDVNLSYAHLDRDELDAQGIGFRHLVMPCSSRNGGSTRMAVGESCSSRRRCCGSTGRRTAPHPCPPRRASPIHGHGVARICRNSEVIDAALFLPLPGCFPSRAALGSGCKVEGHPRLHAW